MRYLECTVLYKYNRSLAFDIGLLKKEKKRKKNEENKKPKCPLEHIFTVFRVPFLQQEEKKIMLQRQGNGLLVVVGFFFSLKLSQKSKMSMHLGILLFQKIYISSKNVCPQKPDLIHFLKNVTKRNEETENGSRV